VWNSNSRLDASPTVDSVTPINDHGLSQTFAFNFSSANGYAWLSLVNGRFTSSTANGDNKNVCRIQYQVATNRLYLYNDAGTGELGPATPGIGGTLSNSQCTLDIAGTSITGSGNTLSMSIPITFNSSFGTGAQHQVMVDGDDTDTAGHASDWKELGTWNVTP
jgi:hypothetical protein